MKVRITRTTNNPWYKDLIGREYEVEEYNSAIWKLINSDLTIYKQDCEIINDDSLEQLAEKLVRSMRDMNEKYGLKFEFSKLPSQNYLKDCIEILESKGYKVEKPKPTDEEICEKIKLENEKIGYIADWSNTDYKYYIIYRNDSNRYTYDSVKYSMYIGAIYTTKEIAERISRELNG